MKEVARLQQEDYMRENCRGKNIFWSIQIPKEKWLGYQNLPL